MKTIASLCLLFLAFGVTAVNAHDLNDDDHAHGGYNYGSYYYGGNNSSYYHPEAGHYHSGTGVENFVPWYHSHGNTHHFHNIANGHTDHTRPYRNYNLYRTYDYEHSYEWDTNKVWGQPYPGRPTMGYSNGTNNTVKTCNCSSYRRY